LQEVEKAAKEGYDGIIIYCYGDPALQAAKQAVRIPVVGLGEASAIFALLLGHKFGILTAGPPEAGTFLMDNLKMYELDHRCVGVLPIGVPVLDLKEGDEKEKSLLVELGRGLIEKGADVIVLGCGSILGVAEAASRELGVPVVIPAAAALKMCEAMISMGVAQSKKGFYPPAAKRRIM
jgi:allantoin racemase